MVDMYALEAYAERHGGSSPFIRTNGVVAKLANAPALHAGD